jgi:hypothetical protein
MVTPDHGRHQREADGDRGGQPVAAVIEDVGVTLIVCLDHLNRRHRVVEADRPEHADHTIPLEAGRGWAARTRADIVDQHDDGRIFSGTALQRLSVNLAVRLEAPHPRRIPPRVGNFKGEPLTAVHHTAAASPSEGM